MNVEEYEKLNSRAKEIAFKDCLDATEQHLANALDCLNHEDILPMETHIDNAIDEFLDLKAMALFARFQDNKKWWQIWRK